MSCFVSTVYVLSILSPSVYCLRHGCRGPGKGRRHYAHLLSYSAWRNRYRFLIAQCQTAHQKKIIMALGFLACRNHFRDCSPGCNCVAHFMSLHPIVKDDEPGLADRRHEATHPLPTPQSDAAPETFNTNCKPKTDQLRLQAPQGSERVRHPPRLRFLWECSVERS